MLKKGKQGLPTLRFGQCWQDADVLLQAIDIRPEQICLSIASAGDNTLAILARGPQRVIAVDMNPAQIYMLELKVAAYRELNHTEFLILVGSRSGSIRESLYRRCRQQLSPDAQAFWDANSAAIAGGLGGAGTFERHLSHFRSNLLRFVQKDAGIERLLRSGTPELRARYYTKEWDNWRWKTLCGNTFNRSLVIQMGRDPGYLEGDAAKFAGRVLDRIHRALTEDEPAENPYLQWLLLGRHTTALPYAWRPENFEAVRANLDRLEWHTTSLQDYLGTMAESSVDRFSLGDIFDPMPPEALYRILEQITRVGKPQGRLAYWNMLVERRRPKELSHRLRPMEALATKLEDQDRSFLHLGLVVEGLA